MIKARIKRIGETQNVSEKFKKRELHVETLEQYPQVINVEFHQDKCDVLNGYKVGQEVEIDYNLRGREWTNPQGEIKVFNTIQGWRIAPLNGQQETASPEDLEPKEDDDLAF